MSVDLVQIDIIFYVFFFLGTLTIWPAFFFKSNGLFWCDVELIDQSISVHTFETAGAGFESFLIIVCSMSVDLLLQVGKSLVYLFIFFSVLPTIFISLLPFLKYIYCDSHSILSQGQSFRGFQSWKREILYNIKLQCNRKVYRKVSLLGLRDLMVEDLLHFTFEIALGSM